MDKMFGITDIHSVRIATAVCISALVLTVRCAGQEFSPGNVIDTAETISRYVEQHMDRFVTPEYLDRHHALRSVQRGGYSNMLADVLGHDAFMGCVDFIRMSFHLDFSLNFGPIKTPHLSEDWSYLPFDRSFPDDPWTRMWWDRESLDRHVR